MNVHIFYEYIWKRVYFCVGLRLHMPFAFMQLVLEQQRSAATQWIKSNIIQATGVSAFRKCTLHFIAFDA